MPVTIALAQHEPRSHPRIQHSETREQFLQQSCPYEYSAGMLARGKTQVEYSSFGTDGPHKLYPSTSSFVRSAVEAWGRHSHLVLRPDDMWFQVLVQLNLYMEKNGQSLRDLFVNHAGKEEIEIHGNDTNDAVRRFENELQKKVKTSWLAPWICPGFSTSVQDDNLTAIVLMMGLMSTFFDYSAEIICGIPSVTLLGCKQDWEHLLGKIDRLQEFGAEPTAYQRRLRPILRRIVHSFEEPASDETRAFWDQLVHAKVKHPRMCGEPELQYIVSGWILGFYYWKSTGRANEKFAEGLDSRHRPGELVYDGVQYGEEYLENLPLGYGKVTLKESKRTGQPEDERTRNWLVAGSIGKAIFDGAPTAYLQQSRARNAGRSPLKKDYGAMSTRSEGKKPTARFSELVGCLNCSRRGPETGSNRPMVQQHYSEKGTLEVDVASASTAIITDVAGHSTIQPRSGWAWFGPQADLGPFVDSEEVSGPTVDAINSCDNVEHFGDGALRKSVLTIPFRL